MSILVAVLPFIYLMTVCFVGVHFKIFTKQYSIKRKNFENITWMITIIYLIVEIGIIFLTFR